jgi:DNA-binding IclR family transcriptional regulator
MAGRSGAGRSGAGRSGRPAVANSTADRAIDILLSFSDDRPTWTAVEIAKAHRLSRSTTYRYLTSLRSYGLIEEDGHGNFQVGSKVFALARVARRTGTTLRVALPILHDLRARTGEMVLLTKRVNHEMVTLECLESPHRVGITFVRGQMLPTPAGASAKVLMAFADPPVFASLRKQLKPARFTARTVTDSRRVLRQLEEVRRQGYAINDEELDEGIRAVAAPIHGAGSTDHAVAVVGPSFRLDDKRLKVLTREVIDAARRISAALAATQF